MRRERSWFQRKMILVPTTNDLTAGKVKQFNIWMPVKVVVVISGVLLMKGMKGMSWKNPRKDSGSLPLLNFLTQIDLSICMRSRDLSLRILSNSKSFSLNCFNLLKISGVCCPIDNWAKMNLALKQTMIVD